MHRFALPFIRDFVAAIAFLALAACGSPEPTPMPTSMPTLTPPPADTPTPDAPPPTASPVVMTRPIPFASGGLGQDEAWWEANYGPGADDVLGKKYGNYTVRFIDGKAASIERQWPTTQAVTAEEALAEGQQFVPADASQVATYSPNGRPETTVNLLMSPSLAAQFETDAFIGGEPGNFTIQYNVVDGRVTGMLMALGNNP